MQKFISKVDRFGRVTLPKGIRDLAGLEPNGDVEVAFSHGDVILHRRNAKDDKFVTVQGIRVIAHKKRVTVKDVRTAIESSRRKALSCRETK